MRYSRQALDWTDQPSWAAALRETTLFGEVVEASHETGVRRPAGTVVGVECTRATFLSFGETDKAGFARELRRLLEPSPEVDLVQETFLAMAPVRS